MNNGIGAFSVLWTFFNQIKAVKNKFSLYPVKSLIVTDQALLFI
jgi:hypothetical protein